jgi:hypothetical protein
MSTTGAVRSTHLLSWPAGDGSLQPEQSTADLVADGGAALLVVVCDRAWCHWGVMMVPLGAMEQTATSAVRACRGGSGSRRRTTPGAEETTDAVVRAGGGCGSWAAGEWMHCG